jgi:hypothetical protein
MLRRSRPHVMPRASPVSCYDFTHEGSPGEGGDAGTPDGDDSCRPLAECCASSVSPVTLVASGCQTVVGRLKMWL